MNQVNSGDESVDSNDDKSKQWEAIDNHLKQMNWFEEGHSPLSASPSNMALNNFIPRPHPQHNPMYRRSEGDLDGRTLKTVEVSQPPQSAPILQKGFVPNWASASTTSALSTQAQDSFTCVSSSISTKPNLYQQPIAMVMNGQIVPNNNSCNYLSTNINPIKIPTPMKQQTGEFGKDRLITRNASENTHFHNAEGSSGNNSPQLKTSNITGSYLSGFPQIPMVTSGVLPGEERHVAKHSMHVFDSQQNCVHPINISSPQSTDVYDVQSLVRRQSMPEKINGISSAGPKLPQRAVSQIYSSDGDPVRSLFASHEHTHSAVPSSLAKVEENEIDSATDDDKEYTIALLQHQEERMNRLQTELEMKRRELASVVSEMQVLEKAATEQSARSSSSMLLDVGRLREINRQLKIDCNCMHREVEHFHREGDNTRDNFYSRYNKSSKPAPKRKAGVRYPVPKDLPPPPVPPPQERDDEPKWRCKYCTFDNHAALNKCEICEYSRDVNSSRIRIS